MILITLSGGKHSKKNLLAMRLAKNSDCVWIKPYTDRKVSNDDYNYLDEDTLTAKMENEKVLTHTIAGGNRYVFFESQLTADYVVLIGDDKIVNDLKQVWKDDMTAIKVHANGEEYSDRNLFNDVDFDVVFNYDRDDYDDLESMIVYR